MSINLYNTNVASKQYSTRAHEVPNRSSRVFQSYRSQNKSQTSRTKAYNMNDEQKRINRNNKLYKETNNQSALFQKGVKKIIPNITQPVKQDSIKRQYHNKQTYDILKPTPINISKLNEGGVRKIYLYDQRKQSNSFREGSESLKKMIGNKNKQSQQKDDSGVYLLKKLATHKNNIPQWHNELAQMKFNKKQNIVNMQNMNKEQWQNKKRSINSSVKNESVFTSQQTGITLKEEIKNNQKIDFKQEYYKKYSRLDNKTNHSKSGYLSNRFR